MNFTPPEHLRKGQSIINFLQWVAAEKKNQLRVFHAVGDHGAHMYIGDIFYVSDELLDAWWQEYVDDLDWRSVKSKS